MFRRNGHWSPPPLKELRIKMDINKDTSSQVNVGHCSFEREWVGKQHSMDLQLCLHWKISTLSPPCVGNVHISSQTPCVHQCIHCPPFLHRRVLRLLMGPSAYQSPIYSLISRARFLITCNVILK